MTKSGHARWTLQRIWRKLYYHICDNIFIKHLLVLFTVLYVASFLAVFWVSWCLANWKGEVSYFVFVVSHAKTVRCY